MSTSNQQPEEGLQETFLTHLFELRDRLIRSIGALLIVFLGLVYWAPDIFHLFAKPLLDALPSGGDYRDWETDRKSTRLNSSHSAKSRMPSSA